MKRILSIFFIVSLASFLMAGCGSLGDIAYDAYNTGKSLDDDSGSSDDSSYDDDTSSKSNKKKKDYGESNDSSDEHFIQADDYFISKDAFKSQAWIYVDLAKMTEQPSSKTKNEGKFMVVRDGREEWTKYYWKTRIATKSDIKLGAVVIIFEGTNEDGVYQAPEDKSQARSYSWFMAKITDTSDLHKGYVTVSGGYKASIENLRIATK